MPWIDIGDEDDFPSGQARAVQAGGRAVAVFRLEQGWFAIDDSCPHQGASLSQGLIHDGRVICPLHNWVFDVKTGACPRNSHEPATAYPVRTEKGRVEVEVDRVG